MSIVVEENEQVVDNLDEEFNTVDNPFEEAVDEEIVDEQPAQEEAPAIPDKFRDKSIEEVINSYQALEKEFGRKNNEIGELRKLTDQMLDLQLKGSKQEAEPKKEVDFDSLMDNPSDVLNSLVNENPRLKAIEDQLHQAKLDTEKTAFEAKHPDAYEKVQSAEFQQWVNESPVRQQMFNEANGNYNYQMADELFTLYEAIQGTRVVAKEESKIKREKDLKAASVEKGSTGAKSRKIYKRADLMRLRMTDPDKYAAMEPEIIRAYQEKRVR